MTSKRARLVAYAVVASSGPNAGDANSNGFNIRPSPSDVELHLYSEKARRRDFFSTETGWTGLGPESLEVGDIVVVPFGASRPFILRSCADEDGCFFLIGDAVVPGIMSGQYMNEQRNSPAQDYYLR